MRRYILFALCALLAAVCLTSCNDDETYGDKKKKERSAIDQFISERHISVIDQATFARHDSTTNLDRNEFVYLSNSAVYMQIVRRGAGNRLPDGKQTNLLLRYTEWNIMNGAYQSRNDYDPRAYDKMTVTRTGSSYTASFASGVMYSTYGASVPAGWLVPLEYIHVGRQSTPDEEIARVRLIVPHTQGHSYATSSVYPCYYEITYQQEK